MPRYDSLENGELTDVSYYILLSLLEKKHGYLIMKMIEEMTNGQFIIGPASLYTTIRKLLAADLIKLDEEKDNKKIYVCTKKGITFLKKEVKRKQEMVKHAEEIFHNKEEV